MGKSSRKKKQSTGRKEKEKARAEQKWMAEYNRLVEEAIGFHREGNMRAVFDKSMEAVLTAPDKWAFGRFYAFDMALKVLHDDAEKATDDRTTSLYNKENRRMLRREFVDNEEEKIIFRLRAAVCVRDLEQDIGTSSEERKTEMTHFILGLLNRSPPADDNRILHDLQFKPELQFSCEKVTVKDILQLYRVVIHSFLHSVPIRKPRCDCHGDIQAPPPSEYRFGGDKCDCCGKPASVLPSPLIKCARCEMMFYCSKTCQVKDWKDHKKNCLKKGYIYEGEVMLLKDAIQVRDDLTWPVHVRVVRASKDIAGVWYVILVGLTTPPGEHRWADPVEVPVSGEHLTRIRQDLVPAQFQIEGQTPPPCLANRPHAKHCVPDMENPPQFRVVLPKDD